MEGIRGADGTCLAELSEVEAHNLIDKGIISGGMISKVTACLNALEAVSCVHIVDGSVPHILLQEIEDKPRQETMLVKK